MDLAYSRAPDGSLNLMRGDEIVLSIPPDGSIAIYFDNGDRHGDDGNAILMKHGPAEDVLARFRQDWSTFQKGEPTKEGAAMFEAIGLSADGFRTMTREIVADLRMVEIPAAEADERILEEVNACLSITGRVGGLEARIETLRQEPRRSGPGMR
jgi:hypothetical protein